MKKIKFLGLSTLLFTGFVHAIPCDSFDLKINNKLDEDLVLSRIQLDGSHIQPEGIKTIESNAAQLFTFSDSSKANIKGMFVFHPVSLPTQEINIKFELKNSGKICEFSDKSTVSDYLIKQEYTPGKVNYLILDK